MPFTPDPANSSAVSSNVLPHDRIAFSTFLTSITVDNRFYTFVVGQTGRWKITAIHPVIGASLEIAPRLDIQKANLQELPAGSPSLLRGVTSNQRYVTGLNKPPSSLHRPGWIVRKRPAPR